VGSNWMVMLAQIILVGFCLFILFQFLRLFRRENLGNDARLLFILLMVVLTVCMAYIPSIIENCSFARITVLYSADYHARIF